MAIEDLTTYTEVDSGTNMAVTASRVDFTTISANLNNYIIKSHGAAHFDAAVGYNYDYEFQKTSGSGYFCPASVTNSGSADAWNGNPNHIVDIENLTPYLADMNPSGTWESGWATGSSISNATLYYVTMSLVGTTLTWDVYTDSGRTTLQQSLSITIVGTTRTFEYLILASSENFGDSAVVTGFVQNVDLKESAGGVTIPVFNKHFRNQGQM